MFNELEKLKDQHQYSNLGPQPSFMTQILEGKVDKKVKVDEIDQKTFVDYLDHNYNIDQSLDLAADLEAEPDFSNTTTLNQRLHDIPTQSPSVRGLTLNQQQYIPRVQKICRSKDCNRDIIKFEANNSFAFDHTFTKIMPYITIKKVAALTGERADIQIRFVNPNLADLKLEFKQLENK